jgi:tetratricopeptide (TPR) repeat protein
MKNIFAMAAVYVAVISCNHSAIPSATPIINTEMQNENGKIILAGHCSLSVLNSDPYKEWFDTTYQKYVVDNSTIGIIKPMLQNKTIEIFLGSWCGDSKREVPRMIKILEAASFDTSNLRLIFVDNSTKTYKQSPQHEEAGKNIHHVPTIIIYDNGKEKNRIIESPVASLEKDMLAILGQKNYTPKYKAIAYWQQHVKNRKRSLNDEALQSLATVIKPLCLRMGEFNAYGYVLLAQKNYTESLNVFRLNTFIYPDNAGTFDSLGEAYMTTGNKEEAKKNYEKVLRLKPGDENAKKMLSTLE